MIFSVFRGCFKRVLKKLQGYFKNASKVLESFKVVSGKFRQRVKSVSRKFCFLILHGTHRSYPSRRRARFF